MAARGIYTLANDVVGDQLVALLNSIEVNVSREIPICVIPFDSRLTRVREAIESRENVTLLDNLDAIQRWENFAQEVWKFHPDAEKKSRSRPPWGKGHHRRFVAFDGPFEQFVYYDADSLAMKPLTGMFEKLDSYDFVFDDWEHRKPDETAALDLAAIAQTGIYSREWARSQLHCSSFFGSKRGIFGEKELADLQEKLSQNREIAWVKRWWDDAFLFNYMTLRCDRSLYNFTQSTDSRDRTGNCADTDPFVNIDGVLYNEQGLKPIHRLHYMNYPSAHFTRLCQGEDVSIRYRDVFLYYRFLQEPDKKPAELKPPSFFTKASRKLKKIVQKVKNYLRI